MSTKVKFEGTRGSWYTKVGDLGSFPTMHSANMKGLHYRAVVDEEKKAKDPAWYARVRKLNKDMLASKIVVIQDDGGDAGSPVRRGYVVAYVVENIVWDGSITEWDVVDVFARPSN